MWSPVGKLPFDEDRRGSSAARVRICIASFSAVSASEVTSASSEESPAPHASGHLQIPASEPAGWF